MKSNSGSLGISPGGREADSSLSPNYVDSGASTPAETGSTASNYVTITGFTGSGFTLTGINPNLSGDGRPRINGFQIVSVPEPASCLLFGLARSACAWRPVAAVGLENRLPSA